jgi:hypothetical protein
MFLGDPITYTVVSYIQNVDQEQVPGTCMYITARVSVHVPSTYLGVLLITPVFRNFNFRCSRPQLESLDCNLRRLFDSDQRLDLLTYMYGVHTMLHVVCLVTLRNRKLL